MSEPGSMFSESIALRLLFLISNMSLHALRVVGCGVKHCNFQQATCILHRRFAPGLTTMFRNTHHWQHLFSEQSCNSNGFLGTQKATWWTRRCTIKYSMSSITAKCTASATTLSASSSSSGSASFSRWLHGFGSSGSFSALERTYNLLDLPLVLLPETLLLPSPQHY